MLIIDIGCIMKTEETHIEQLIGLSFVLDIFVLYFAMNS